MPAGGWSISDRDAPQGEDRNALVARRAHLRNFTPADRTAIGARVARMFLRFPGTAKSAGLEAMVAAYVIDLERFPLWAIDRGIGAIIQGHVLKTTEFAPSSLDVQAAVQAGMRPVQDELTILSAVLDADVWHDPGPAERKRVTGGFDKLLTDLKTTNSFQPPAKAKDARDPVRPASGVPIDHSAPVTLSAAAKATFTRREETA